MKKIIAMSLALLCITAPVSASAVVQSPPSLMTKGLRQLVTGGGRPWKMHCTGWQKRNANNYESHCHNLRHRNLGVTASGTGWVYLNRKYDNWYWAFGYNLTEDERPCRIDGEERGNYEEEKEFWEERLRGSEQRLEGAERERSNAKSAAVAEVWEHLAEEEMREIEKLKQEEPRLVCDGISHSALLLSEWHFIFLH